MERKSPHRKKPGVLGLYKSGKEQSAENAEMNFCFNCGTKLDAGSRFCPECGTRLVEEIASATPSPETVPAENPTGTTTQKDTKSFAKYGFILTNTAAIAKSYVGLPYDAPEENALANQHYALLLERLRLQIDIFIEKKKLSGVHYTLLDVSDYTFRCCNRRVSLTGKNSVIDFLDVLLDAHNDEVRRGLPESTYLFIIGGENVVPAPRGPFWVPDCDDTDTDADLLYSFPYGAEAVEALQNGQIFKYDALFMVGRLPDKLSEPIEKYLIRAAECGNGIPLLGAYAQSDPHWKVRAANVAGDLRDKGLFPQFEKKLPQEIFFRDVFLSPAVAVENGITQKVFNRHASLFYFNLHGSGSRTNTGFYGESMEGVWYTAMVPEILATPIEPNVIVTVACYGGRFVGYSPDDSSALQTLGRKSLLYLGSSRIAFGGGGAEGELPAHFATSDYMAWAFMRLMLAGADAGTALFAARRGFFQKGNTSVYDLTTVVEFNLFGDPTLRFDVGTQKSMPELPVPNGKCGIAPKDAKIGVKTEQLSVDGNEKAPSLLERVRGQVNANLAGIHNSVTKHLYDNYGVKPRELSSTFRVKYADGREELQLAYDLETKPEFKSKMLVATDTRGNVLTVAHTK